MVRLERCAERGVSAGPVWVRPEAVVMVEDAGVTRRSVVTLAGGERLVVEGLPGEVVAQLAGEETAQHGGTEARRKGARTEPRVPRGGAGTE